MGAAAVPLFVATSAFAATKSISDTQSAKALADRQRNNAKRFAKGQLEIQEKQRKKSEATSGRDEKKQKQKAKAAGRSGRPGTIKTTPLGIIEDDKDSSMKTLLGT